MKLIKAKQWVVVMLVMTMLAASFGGMYPLSQANAASVKPDLLITEIVPATSGANEAFEYVELYNNTTDPIDLSEYYLFYYTSNAWQLGKTIQPKSTMVLWLKKLDNLNNPSGPNALSDFNANYGVTLTSAQVYEVNLTTSAQGLSNNAERLVAVGKATSASDRSHLVATAYINKNGEVDGTGKANKSVTYRYPATTATNEMRKIANNQPATPGMVLDSQLASEAPTGLAAQPGNQQVTLTWSANSESDITGYNVYRVGAAQPATVSGITYTVNGLTNDTQYQFRITAVNADGYESADSSIVQATPTAVVDTVAPAAPSGVSAASSSGTVTVSWAPNTEPDMGGYKVYADGTLSQTVSASTYSAALTTLTAGKAYSFAVSAYDKSNNESAKSAAVRGVPAVGSIPAILITELVADTDNHYAGFDAYEFAELYNTTDAAIDLSGYSLSISNTDPANTWKQAIEGPAVIGPKETFLIWTRKGELSALTKADFNHYYYASYTDKYIREDHISIMNGVSGLINTNPQTVTLLDPSQNEVVKASYNPSGKEVVQDNGINYGYPTDGTKVVRKLNTNLKATPGYLTDGQVPDVSGSDLQAPAAPTGVTATAGAGEVKLVWADNTEPDLAAYRIYKNGVLDLTLPAGKQEVTVPALTGNVTYTFEVAAADVYGNISPKSTPVTAVPTHQKMTQTDRSLPLDKTSSPDFWNLSEPGLVVPGLAQDVVPQGVAYDKERDWIVVSYYREDGRPSMLSVVDAKTNLLIKSINVYQEDNTPYTGHAGGVTISKSNLWLASGGYMYRIPLNDIVQAADAGEVRFADRFLTNARASYAEYKDGILWAGEFYEENSATYPTDASHKLNNRDGKQFGAWLVGYKLDPDTDMLSVNQPLDTTNTGAVKPFVPDYVLATDVDIQGVHFMDDQIVLSQSFSRAKLSNLLRFNNVLNEAPHQTVVIGQTTVPLWFLDNGSKKEVNPVLVSPPMTEGMLDRSGKLYVLFESGANAYRATAFQTIDRMQLIDLNGWEKYNGIAVQGVPSTLEIGKQTQVTVMQNWGSAPAVDVTAFSGFTSSSPEVAEISAQGLITARSTGETVIHATYGAYAQDANLKVFVRLYSSGSRPPASNGAPAGEVAQADSSRFEITAAELKTEQDATAVTVPADKQAVALPGNISNSLQQNRLLIHFGQFTVSIGKETLQKLTAPFGAEALQDADLTLGFSPLDPATRDNLLQQAGQAEHAVVRAAGDMLDLSLTLTLKNGEQSALTQFEQPIVVSFKVDPNARPELLGVYYIHEDGTAEYVGGQMKDGMLQAELSHFSPYAVLEYDKQYSDVPAGHWAAQAVRTMSAQHIVNGVNETEFAPSAQITRAEFATLLVRGLGLTSSQKSSFADVQPADWYAASIAAAAEAGIVNGRDDNRFAPNEPVSREEMAALLVRAAQYKGAKLQQAAALQGGFADQAQISGWAKTAVDTAAKSGLLQGKDAAKFEPHTPATRAESAQAIYNLLAQYVWNSVH
ncbi:S-layer homology domain-containing protein [Paenibacillus thalictri]|uniref:Uncharacterized protein n=1 Tax=Paenibacillus thalictri TaxID=2527873 RepID=A0A4Q9DPB6_9BACL|nr:S-layer homology domain-containing protein [Paenibacillus thalictri]TBL78145.1 hypothetical protein EYB31_14770 [Paenibacillus thalictri]